MIVVQQIQVVWTKQSRGGRGAQRRAAVPDLFPPSLTAVPAATSVLVQHVRATEAQGFGAEIPVVAYRRVEEVDLDDLGLVVAGERLRVVRRADTFSSQKLPTLEIDTPGSPLIKIRY